MNLNKVTLVVITLTIAIAFLSFVAYYKFVYQPFQLSSGIPSTALISVNGVDIIVYDNTQTIEISELNFGTFEVGDYSESKWSGRNKRYGSTLLMYLQFIYSGMLMKVTILQQRYSMKNLIIFGSSGILILQR